MSRQIKKVAEIREELTRRVQPRADFDNVSPRIEIVRTPQNDLGVHWSVSTCAAEVASAVRETEIELAKLWDVAPEPYD